MASTEFIMAFGGFIIVTMLSIIGYFLNRLVRVVDKLDCTVNKMQVAFKAQEVRLDNLEKNCNQRYAEIVKK